MCCLADKVAIVTGSSRGLGRAIAQELSEHGAKVAVNYYQSKDEAELRALWSVPDTRKLLLAGLAEKGFGHEQLSEMQKIIDDELLSEEVLFYELDEGLNSLSDVIEDPEFLLDVVHID